MNAEQAQRRGNVSRCPPIKSRRTTQRRAAQMPEDRGDRSSQDFCACILLAHRPRVLPDIVARSVHVLYLVSNISSKEERQKKKVPTRKRTREDGDRKRLQRSGTSSSSSSSIARYLVPSGNSGLQAQRFNPELGATSVQ